jgi:hypothetical protein
MNGGRPVGLAKTGGRQKGTPNRATISLQDKLAGLGCDPLGELVRIARDSKTKVETTVQIYFALLPYLFPKRKPVEISDEESTEININTNLDNSGDSTDGDQCQPNAQASPSTGV